MTQSGRETTMERLAAVTAEMDDMARTLARPGWQAAWSRPDAPQMDDVAWRRALRQADTGDAALLGAAIQLEKRQRRLMRLITHRMQGLREDIRHIESLDKRLAAISGTPRP